jgi:hypothetical protein
MLRAVGDCWLDPDGRWVGPRMNGVRAGMFGLPKVGVIPGFGPCISTVTPCGMLAIRTMAGSFTMGVFPLEGCWLAGTFMNNPGSMCSAWLAVCEYPSGFDGGGAGSASLTRWR